jgi:hypothetical protein
MLTNEMKYEILKPYEEAEQKAWKAYDFARKYGVKSEREFAKIEWAMATARVVAVEATLLEVTIKTA